MNNPFWSFFIFRGSANVYMGKQSKEQWIYISELISLEKQLKELC